MELLWTFIVWLSPAVCSRDITMYLGKPKHRWNYSTKYIMLVNCYVRFLEWRNVLCYENVLSDEDVKWIELAQYGVQWLVCHNSVVVDNAWWLKSQIAFCSVELVMSIFNDFCKLFNIGWTFYKWKLATPDSTLTLILLTWTIWRAPTNASKWRMGFNPCPANVDNMASSYQCQQMADGI